MYTGENYNLVSVVKYYKVSAVVNSFRSKKDLQRNLIDKDTLKAGRRYL